MNTTHELEPVRQKPPVEYIVVADKTSKVLLSTPRWSDAVKTANLMRRAGGEVTIFKSTNG